MDRITMLEQFIASQPDDPFPLYGLALELKKAGRLEEARDTFDRLAKRFPDYVAQYLMAGGVLSELGDSDRARQVYENGIQVSGQKGDLHAKSELEAALAGLEESE